MHVISLSGTVATPNLRDGSYAFTITTPSNLTALGTYFNAKAGWTSAMEAMINAEINGTIPFFYLKANGGTYSIVDNFKQAFGISSPFPLTIDDDYPLGTYSYAGILAGSNGSVQPLTITLAVH